MNKVVEKWDEILQIVKTEHYYRAFRAGRSQLYK